MPDRADVAAESPGSHRSVGKEANLPSPDLEQGVLVARGLSHLLANDLAPAAGVLDLLRTRSDLPSSMTQLVDDAVAGILQAREHLHELQTVLRSVSEPGPRGATAAMPTHPASSGASRPRPAASVVIADDDSHVRSLVRATLASDQYAVLEAADGDLAWQLIQERQPGVAVLDVRMPGRSGLEILRAIRADPALAGMRVILLTGEGTHAIAQGAIQDVRPDLFLTKPFSPLRLLNAVEQALGLA